MNVQELMILLEDYFENTPVILRINGVDDQGQPTAVEAEPYRIRVAEFEGETVVLLEAS